MKPSISSAKHKPAKRVSHETVGPEKERSVSVRGRIWLDMNGETYLAPGRVTLLERIDEYGSITKAAKSMEMSYRHAWVLVDDMNRKAPSPLVMRIAGGKGGGGTVLTDAGKAAVSRFNALQKKMKEFTEELSGGEALEF